MKIAQVSPLYESVPPKYYGGTERVVHYLTEELVRQGHEVTLFASGDSMTSARLVATSERSLRLDPQTVDAIASHVVQLQEVMDRAGDFDLIHFHTDYLHFPMSNHLSVPHLTTLHGRLNIPELQPLYHKFPLQPVVSISNEQRTPLPQANFIGTVYHGLPVDLHQPGRGDGGYLAFLGRISPEKGVVRAIEIAIAAGMKLKIAAKIEKLDHEYYQAQVKHLFDHPLIEYIGEIREDEKSDFLGKSKAMLFPIYWSEPFGLVMIESMACGTPVIAHAMGSVPEVIDHGRSGFIVGTVEEAVQVIRELDGFSREGVRKLFEQRFTSVRMAADYINIYQRLVPGKSGSAQVTAMPGQFMPFTAADPGISMTVI